MANIKCSDIKIQMAGWHASKIHARYTGCGEIITKKYVHKIYILKSIYYTVVDPGEGTTVISCRRRQISGSTTVK